MCKQNDKTKSVPDDVNLTLQLHTQTPGHCHLLADCLLYSSGGREGGEGGRAGGQGDCRARGGEQKEHCI